MEMEQDKKYIRFKDLMLYNIEVSNAEITYNNEIRIMTTGKEKFKQLIKDINNAQCFIHLQYYIIQKDELWTYIEKALLRAAERGVKVRVLYDGLGTRKMGNWRWKYLQSKGIEVGMYYAHLLGNLHPRINYRNHRKIVVIDGNIGYVGGFNIGREYLGREKRFGNWRDTHLRIVGGAVATLDVRFSLDYHYATGKNLFLETTKYIETKKNSKGNTCVQIISSGPDTPHQQIRDNFLRLIHKAKKNVYIQTPYFVPDQCIITALKLAAISGVDVRIMIPCKPDHPLVYWATYSYVGELLEVGAKCYIYNKGFLHAKVLTVDGLLTCCGTANMDIRSFKLNYEVNAVIYNEVVTKKMDQIFKQDLEECSMLTQKHYNQRGGPIRIKEATARVFSPLL